MLPLEPSQSPPHVAGSSTSPRESQALLRECFSQFADRLRDAMHTSVGATNDLFDSTKRVSIRDIADFRERRPQLLLEYERTLRMLYTRRIGGTRRSGRRLDSESTIPTIQLLDPLDQEMQVALIGAVKDLQLATGVELIVLSHRVAVLLGEKPRPAFDNPFDPQYWLDALGWAARATYPTPQIWRSVMRRIVTDITPVLVKVYIAQNRFLADQNVLPQIKAELRSRSRHRPTDDRDLLLVFGRLMTGASAAGIPIMPVVVPPVRMGTEPVRSERAPDATPPARVARIQANVPAAVARMPPVPLPAPVLRTALEEVARVHSLEGEIHAHGTTEPDALPSLDPLMALGTTHLLVATLGRLQRMDLPQAILHAAPAFDGHKHVAAIVPSNLIPHLRTVLAVAITRDQDAMVMDFVSLMFDYVFGDPSIPQSLHGVFERLQVPIVKIAVIDSEFFTRGDHPARKLLDSLAAASIGAAADTAYFREFEAVATDVVRLVCNYPHLDASIYFDATAAVDRFIEEDRERTAEILADDIAEALGAEMHDHARAQARAMVRDRLAGMEVPPRVRMFVESNWVDYLTRMRQTDRHADYDAACVTLDDLLWSLTAKDRQSQRRRLAAMIPALVVALRNGCATLELPRERTADFFNDLFGLHLTAMKKTDEALARKASEAAEPARGRAPTNSKGICDFVGEMIVGSWIAFLASQRGTISRLWWVSPMRTRYVFTDRERSRGWVLSPEELAHHLEAGTASVVAEPISLFDRAVSAAFDAIGERPAAAGAD